MTEITIEKNDLDELKLVTAIIAQRRNELLLLEKGGQGFFGELLKKYGLDENKKYKINEGKIILEDG